MKNAYILILLFWSASLRAQVSYFPPKTGTAWDTVSPSTLGWCPERIDTLYQYLQERNSQGFIVLHDGKIVLEKYFGTFTRDSIHYWASAGKSLTAALVGIAAQENLLDINQTASTYLGNGWSSAPVNKESLVTIKNLLSMTSGFTDNPTGGQCDAEDTAAACLQYAADAGTLWTYQTGAYKKLHKIVSIASNTNYNTFTNNRMGSRIGMAGLWYNGVFYSVPRGMARFGLLMLNHGVWQNDTILKDTTYYNAMINTSQPLNEAYGYLWWLNGKSSVMAPGIPIVFNRELFADAPPDMYSALGKNDQKIYVAPSRNMVVVRVGDAAYTSQAAFSDFDNELWILLDNMTCQSTRVDNTTISESIQVYPNPVSKFLFINWPVSGYSAGLFDCTGRKVMEANAATTQSKLDCSSLANGIYYLHLQSGQTSITKRVVIQHVP